MAKRTETVEPDEILETEQAAPVDDVSLDRETKWIDADSIPHEMVQIPYAYLMQDTGELAKRYPGASGQWYVAGVGPVPDGLVIVPVQVGFREEEIKRDGKLVREEVYRLRAVEMNLNMPVVFTLRGTSKQQLRALLAAVKFVGAGMGRMAFRVTSDMTMNDARQTWFIPVFEALDIEPDACLRAIGQTWGRDDVLALGGGDAHLVGF